MEAVTHYNIRRVVDVFGSVQDRDLGAVTRDVQKIVDANKDKLPKGTFITVRGQAQTMRTSYVGLLTGLAFAIVLLYMLIVVNFQSWLDPFIIITALPAALGGIVLSLFFTHTTLSVPALTGAIMCMGVATANSILVVSFAKERLGTHGDAIKAAVESGATRFRPVIMTALAMIIGMVPMAMGLGDGGEQNAPLGRAVIGGLLFATIATLFFVPVVFGFLHHRRGGPRGNLSPIPADAARCRPCLIFHPTDFMTETHSIPTPPHRRGLAPARPCRNRRSARSHAGLVFGLLLLVGIGAAIYFGIQSRTAAEAETQRVALDTVASPVQVITPQKGSLGDEISLPGNTQAFSDTAIYARTSGYLKSWKVDIGAHVKQDQVLAEIETPELDQQLDQAEAELKSAQANLEISQITASRLDALLKTDAVSHQERDQAMSDLAAKKALMNSAEANVRRLKKLQAFETVNAPFDGVITARNTDVGALIKEGDNTTAKELFHIAAIKTLRVFVSVPEVYAASVKNGLKVSVVFSAYPAENFTGTVIRNNSAIEQHSRTLNVEVDVENSKGLLYPGGYATVLFKLPANADSFTIPSNTLLFRSEGLRVAVAKGGHAKLVPIKIGHDFGSTVEVVAGLSADDKVILDPSDSLADDAPVRVEENVAKK